MKYSCKTCGKPLDGPPLGDDCFNCQDEDMDTSSFYRKYANTPLAKRFTPLPFNESGEMTLADIHKRMCELDDQMRPLRIEQRNLLRKAYEVMDKMGLK